MIIALAIPKNKNDGTVSLSTTFSEGSPLFPFLCKSPTYASTTSIEKVFEQKIVIGQSPKFLVNISIPFGATILLKICENPKEYLQME